MKILLVLPVYNEEVILRKNVEIIKNYISENLNEGVTLDIIIADNASTDKTRDISLKIKKAHNNVDYLRVDRKGRGSALQEAWAQKGYDIYFYMDTDLSYDLSVIMATIIAFEAGNQIVVASRLLKNSIVERHWLRKFLTKNYNRLLKLLFNNGFNDAQAGCKAISSSVRDKLLPLLKEDGWFFDTLLLILAERNGYGIHELPIKCGDPRKWRLKIISTVMYFFYKTLELRMRLNSIKFNKQN